MDGSLFERGRALEEHFFSEKDKQLLANLKQEMKQKELRDGLAACSGITDTNVLDELISNQVTAESMTSIALVPLVAVAWADGSVQENERQAILRAAKTTGIEEGSAAYQLMESWLAKEPADTLLQAWKDYVASLKAILDATSFDHLKTTVVQRAREVADSAGGFLGIGKTSDRERAVINEIERSFE